jgi:hypothetical protein
VPGSRSRIGRCGEGLDLGLLVGSHSTTAASGRVEVEADNDAHLVDDCGSADSLKLSARWA